MKKRILILVILMAVGIGGWALYQYVSGEEAPTNTFYGNVDIREVTLGFRIGGRIAALHYDEGEAVASGALMAELDPQPYADRKRQAQAELELRQSRLEMLRNGYRSEEIEQARARLTEAEANLRNARLKLERQRHLQESGASTQQNLDDAEMRFDQAKASLEVAQANLNLLKAGFRPEEIAQAEAEVGVAEAKLASAETDLGDTRLVAPGNAIVRTRAAEPGTVVGAGTPVFVLSLQENPWVRAYVPEARLGAIAPGQRVEVFTDSREAPYPGRIGFISPTAEFTPKSIHTEELRTNLVYRFRVVIDGSAEGLRQGMPVTVKLLSNERTDAAQ